MPYQIESVNNWPAGDTRIFPFIVEDEDSDSEFFDLSGADIEWKLKDTVTDEVVLSLDDSGVSSTITNATEGKFEVEVDKSATSELEGRFREIIQITDSRGNLSTWNGRVEIEDID